MLNGRIIEDYTTEVQNLVNYWNDNNFQDFNKNYIFDKDFIESICNHWKNHDTERTDEFKFNRVVERDFIELIVKKASEGYEKVLIVKTMKKYNMNYKEFLC